MPSEQLIAAQSAEVLVVEVFEYLHAELDVASALYGVRYLEHYHPSAHHPLISANPERNSRILELIKAVLDPLAYESSSREQRKRILAPKQVESLTLRFGFQDGMLRNISEVTEAMGLKGSSAVIYIEDGLNKLRNYHRELWLPYLGIRPITERELLVVAEK